jgi:hypothetical protein
MALAGERAQEQRHPFVRLQGRVGPERAPARGTGTRKALALVAGLTNDLRLTPREW